MPKTYLYKGWLASAGLALLISCLIFLAGCRGVKADDVAKENTGGETVEEANVLDDETPLEETNPQTESKPMEESEETEEQPKESIPDETKAGKVSTPEALHVEGTALVDDNGNPVQLRGISTHGLAWFPDYVNEECFKQLHEEWGVDVIRLAMYTAEYGGYCTGGDRDALKKLVKDGVEYATNQNMYVIIDWHILSDGNPGTYKEEAKAFFAEMAETYAEYSNVLYEICNEPNGGVGWADIKAYAEEVIGVIRTYDEDGIILVGTPNWSQYVNEAAADPITGYDNIMYTLHFYAATHKDSLRDTMKAAIDAGLPVFVSEFGICDASGNGSIDEAQADEWVRVMDEYGVSYVAWNLSNKAEASAIIDSGCNKTSGFSEEDLSSSGKWLYRMLSGS